jgi:hypothetical protein
MIKPSMVMVSNEGRINAHKERNFIVALWNFIVSGT